MADNLSPTSQNARRLTPGWRSSEFWVVLSVQILGWLLQADIFPREHLAMKILGLAAVILSALGYKVFRYRLKAAAMTAPLGDADLEEGKHLLTAEDADAMSDEIERLKAEVASQRLVIERLSGAGQS